MRPWKRIVFGTVVLAMESVAVVDAATSEQTAFYAFIEKAQALYTGKLLKRDEMVSLVRALKTSAPLPTNVVTVLDLLQKEPYALALNQQAITLLDQSSQVALKARQYPQHNAIDTASKTLKINADALQQLTDAYTY